MFSVYFICILAQVLQLGVSLSNDEKVLKVGAFNIRVFGKTKMEKIDVVNVLVDIVSRYDIILVQEIRDATGSAFEELVTITNQRNPDDPFSYKISPRLGRTNSKEQYAYLYREKSGLKVVKEYVFNDGDESQNTETNIVDTFEREPYIVLIDSSKTELKRFALGGIHVSPSRAVEELQRLGEVFEDIRKQFGTDQIMIMGDFNAGCSYVPKYKWDTIPVKNDVRYTWWIDDDVDTTIGDTDCAYDRFVSTGDAFKSGVINGSAGIDRFDLRFGLNQTFSLQVSDHYPIEMDLVLDKYTINSSIDLKSDTSNIVVVMCTLVSMCMCIILQPFAGDNLMIQ